MSDGKVDQQLCDERMTTVTCDMKEIKADVKTVLARINAYTSSAQTVKESLDELWTQFNQHRDSGNDALKKDLNEQKQDLKDHVDGHWKWTAVYLSILAVGASLIAFLTPLFKK